MVIASLIAVGVIDVVRFAGIGPELLQPCLDVGPAQGFEAGTHP